MRKKIAAGLVVLGLLAVAATANAFHVHVVAGNLVLDAEGGFAPKALPKHENAPITTHGGGSLSTLSGDLPPILDTFVLEFDKHGALDTTGLGVCTKGKLIATDVKTARNACKDAIVGEGFGSAVVKFPEQAPIKVGSPITLFNGPKKGADDTIIAHAHLDYPGPTTFIVPIVIEKIHKGVYGYRTDAKIPKLVNGYGHPVSGFINIGREWTYKGKRHSYISARCENGHLQARGKFGFEDGTLLSGTFFRPCKVLK
jgi:hypothetical protein